MSNKVYGMKIGGRLGRKAFRKTLEPFKKIQEKTHRRVARRMKKNGGLPF